MNTKYSELRKLLKKVQDYIFKENLTNVKTTQ